MTETTCTGCNGSGEFNTAAITSIPLALVPGARRSCIPCGGSGRLPQAYPVRA